MANGNFAGGDGTEQNPYLIEDAFDLDAIRNGLDKCYKLIKDIDLDIKPFNEGEGWKPIGKNNNNDARFKGTLNGNSYNIYNLYLNGDNSGDSLFKGTYKAKIIDLGLININIKSNWGVAPLIFDMRSGIVERCYTTGNVVNNGLAYLSGLIGVMDEQAILKNCYSKVGLICLNSVSYVGGICAYMGLNNTTHIYNSYFSAKCINKNTISKIYGIVSRLEHQSTVLESFWDEEVFKMTSSKWGKGKTTKEMKSAQTFIDANWDKEKLEDDTPVWILQDGEYPKLWFEKLNKYLIQDINSNLYTIKDNQIIQLENNILSEDNFKTNGIDNKSIITKEILLSKFNSLNGLKLKMWTDNIDKQESKLTYECEPFELTQWLKDNKSKLLVYTDDLEKGKCEMSYNLKPYRAVDKLKQINDGKFDIVMKETQ